MELYFGNAMRISSNSFSIMASHPRFAFGLAGLGCVMPPIVTDRSCRAIRARSVVNRPTPTTQHGLSCSIVRRSARSQAANRASLPGKQATYSPSRNLLSTKSISSRGRSACVRRSPTSKPAVAWSPMAYTGLVVPSKWSHPAGETSCG